MQKSVLSDVFKWIENNIEEKISVTMLEDISGYSKRHLLNVFLKYTGTSPGEYVRHRRLCRAAFLLRLTNRKLVDIACQLNFDSQQSFSRAFSKLFCCSPSQYRKSAVWDFNFLRLPAEIDKVSATRFEFCYLTSKKYYGYSLSYHHELYDDKGDDVAERYEKIIMLMNEIKMDIYIGSVFFPHETKDCQVTVNSFVGFFESVDSKLITNEEYLYDSGYYIKFSLVGNVNECANLSRQAYLHVLPELALKRRVGPDIEVFKYIEGCNINMVYYDYFIPVIQPF